jgi:hypothetical protein
LGGEDVRSWIDCTPWNILVGLTGGTVTLPILKQYSNTLVQHTTPPSFLGSLALRSAFLFTSPSVAGVLDPDAPESLPVGEPYPDGGAEIVGMTEPAPPPSAATAERSLFSSLVALSAIDEWDDLVPALDVDVDLPALG